MFQTRGGCVGLSVSWWLPASLRAATQAKMAISALVMRTCSIVVNIVNGTPAVRSFCGRADEDGGDGRALIKKSEDAKEVVVTY